MNDLLNEFPGATEAYSNQSLFEGSDDFDLKFGKPVINQAEYLLIGYISFKAKQFWHIREFRPFEKDVSFPYDDVVQVGLKINPPIKKE